MENTQIRLILLEAKRHEALAALSEDPTISAGHLSTARTLRVAARTIGKHAMLIPVDKRKHPCK